MLVRTIFKNALFVTLGSALLKALNFLFSIYVVRQLGDERFGQYSVVLAFVGLFQIFAELGMTQYAMREIAQDHRRTAGLFWNLVAVRLGLAVLAMGGITFGALLAGYATELVIGVFLYASSFLLAAFQSPLQAVLTAHERFDYTTGMNVVGQLAFVICGALFLFSGLGYLWLIVASLINLLVQISLGWWAVQRHSLLGSSGQLEPRRWLGLVRNGLPFGMITLTITIAYSIDTVMLKMFYPDNVVGWYNVAYNLIFSIMFLVNGFKEAIVPSLARTYVTDPAQVDRWYYRTLRMILFISLPIAVGGMLIAGPLIDFLYTNAFAPSAIALRILIWDVPFLMFTAFCGNITTIISKEKAAARIYGLNAIANVLLNLLLIPWLGFVGASIVTVLTDIIGAVQFHYLLRQELHLPKMGSILLRVSLATVLMGAVIWILHSLNFILLIALGVITYALLSLGLRILDEQEWTLIRRVLRRLHLSSTV